jgi:hypothetical protein
MAKLPQIGDDMAARFRDLERRLAELEARGGGPDVPCVRAIWTAPTTAVAGVATPIAWGATDYDPNDMHDAAGLNTRITFPVAGVYGIGGRFEMAQTAELATNLIDIWVRRNGIADVLVYDRRLDHGSQSAISCSTEAKMAVGDYVELMVVNGDNVNHNIVAGNFWASFRGQG